MFQEVTEVFGLSALIGTTPEGTIFQFALCLLLYNMIQVVRGVIATETEKPREKISTENLFDDVQRELIAWSVVIDPEATLRHFEGEWTALRVKARLSELLGAWESVGKSTPQEKEDLQQNLWVNGLFRRDEGSDVQGRASLPDFATSMTATRGLIAAPWTSLASLCCRRKRHPLRSSSGQIRPPDSAIQ